MSTTTIDRLYQFMMEEFSSLRTDMQAGFVRLEDKFDSKIDGIYVQLDGIHEVIDRHETERLAQNAQLDRHERQLSRLYPK